MKKVFAILLLLAAPLLAQEKKISELPDATTPLGGSETIPLVQSSVTKKITATNMAQQLWTLLGGLPEDALDTYTQILTSGPPTDGQCLTWATGVAAFNWAPCGNPEYDPNRKPSTCAACEEWTGDAASLSWAWGNQESTTETIEMDGATILHPADSSGLAFRYVTGPSSSADWTMTAKVTPIVTTSFNGIGLMAILSGTPATPTDIRACIVNAQTSSTIRAQFQSYASYTATGSPIGAVQTETMPIEWARPVYLQIRWAPGTGAMSCWHSVDGRVFRQVGDTSLIGFTPTDYIGITAFSLNASEPGGGHVEFWRVRTDANRNRAGE